MEVPVLAVLFPLLVKLHFVTVTFLSIIPPVAATFLVVIPFFPLLFSVAFVVLVVMLALPSTLFGQFGDERVTAVGLKLDAELERTLHHAAD